MIFILNCDRNIPHIPQSVSWLLMAWWWKEPGHQQQWWYWPSLPGIIHAPNSVSITHVFLRATDWGLDKIRQFHMDLSQYLVQLWHFSQLPCQQYEVHPKGVTSAGCGEYKEYIYKQPWKICRKLDQYQTWTKHDNAPTLCIFLGMYMIWMWTLDWMDDNAVSEGGLIFFYF